jgi:hypothetical protein
LKREEEFRGGTPSDFSPCKAKNKYIPFLKGLCLGKNTLSRAKRGLAPTKAGLIARCDKRECPIVSQKCHQGIFVKRPWKKAIEY